VPQEYFNMNMKKNGFTLVELIIAIAVGLLILTAIYASINMAQRSSASVGRKVTTQQDARAVLDLMATEIRMASYNPTSSFAIWNTIPTGTCASMGSVAAVKANKGIQTAANATNTIIIAMDLHNPPSVFDQIGDVANEYIEYSYDGADTITRNVNCGGDQVILGGTGSATMVRNADTTPVTPLFQYFDSSNNDITTTVVNNNSSTINGVPAIRRIRITIVADTESKDSLTSKARRMTYTTDVLVKNHAFNN
jgi:prepilin-type N-terminal cleavage/methylation domain-containing protein